MGGDDDIERLRAALAARDAELRALRARLDEVEESETQSPEPVVLVSSEGVILTSNGALEQWTDGEVVGRTVWDLVVEEERAQLEEVFHSGFLGVAELVFALPTGRRVALSAYPDDGDRFIVGLHDVTTREVLDAAHDHRRRMQALSDLSGAIARELNDPMSIVQGRLELLLDLGVTDPDATRKHCSIALEHARRVSATLRNLRLVGRAAVPQLQAIALAVVVEEALSLVGPRRDRVLVDLESDDLEAGGDPAMVARVLSSVLRQTLESVPRGPVQLSARKRRDGIHLRAGARRRGRSQPELDDDLSIDRTLLRSVGGTLVMERAGGELSFSIRLPLPPARRSRPRPVEGCLVVVGSESFERTVSTLLDKDGFSFCACRDGEAALERLAGSADIFAVATELFLQRGMSGLSLAQVVVERHPELAGRVLLVSDAQLEPVPESVVAVSMPLRRSALLEALGRRVRRR